MGGWLADLNVKLTGLLARLRDRGFWTADRGETLLLATQHAIRADIILLKGLGDVSLCNEGGFSERVREAGTALDKIGVRDFGITIPNPSYLETSVPHLVEPFLSRHHEETDFLLKIVYSVQKGGDIALRPLEERLRARFRDRLQVSILMDFRKDEQDNTS
jgi:hypothetical protein